MSKDKFIKWQALHKAGLIKDHEDTKNLRKVTEEVQGILDSFAMDEGNTMITYKQLSEMDFDVWFDLGNGVKFMRIENPTKPVYYITEMTPKDSPTGVALFGNQEHNCKEVGKVLEGELIEIKEYGKRYEKGDTFIYPANYIHKPSSSVPSKYEVEFLNPDK